MTIDCADQLRKQAVWIYEALQPDTPDEQRIDLGDVDLDVLLAAADELDALRLRAAKAEEALVRIDIARSLDTSPTP